MTSKRRTQRTVTQLLVACCALALGCLDRGDQQKSTQTPQIRQELSIPLVYTAETERFVQEATAAFNRVRNTVGDSATVVLKPLRGDARVAQQLIQDTPTQPFLWLTRSSPKSADSENGFTQEPVQRSSCSSLLFTTPALAYRPADAFLFGPEEEPANLKSILEQSWPSALSEPRLVVGHPLLTPSGSSAVAFLMSAATGVSFKEFSVGMVSGRVDELSRVERRIAHRFADEQRMLSWLASRQGGAPLLAVTTEQQLQHFSRQSDHPRLHKRRFSQTPAEIAYPLCVFEPAQADATNVQGIRLARGFLMSPHAAKIAVSAGFSERDASRIMTETVPEEALAELVRSTHDLPGDNLLSFVIDTSAAFERALLDSLRNQLAGAVAGLSSPPYSLSITSCSTTAETFITASGDRQLFSQALAKLRPSGGFAFRDCILKTIGTAAERPNEFTRTTIIVITRGRETQSMADINHLKLLIPRQLDQINAVLYVVSIGENESANQQLNSLAHSCGAVVVPTTPATLDRDLQSLLDELS